MIDPIVENVRSKILVRSIAGIDKYGCTMERMDLSLLDWLKHAQEEALDQAIYLEKIIALVRAELELDT